MNIPFLLALTLILSGCSTPKPEEIVKPGSKSDAVVENYADANDLAAGKASASVKVAIDANKAGKPEVVGKELEVAEANLPRPTPADLAEARERSGKQDAKAYDKALVDADKVQKQIEDLWAKVEAQRAEDRAKADAEIARMKMQIEEERKTKVLLIFAGVGGLITIAGVALFIFGSKPNGVGLIAIGAGIGSLGFFWGSPAFDWLMIGLIGLSGLMGLIWLGKRIFAKAQ
ncbi:hypothetical protein UFOVP510_49 [uncultured Caudovirales phage]|uniref:Uncharacterized protein n=1 Tax=uncultured Caudovirales phage TaxID=2100421 RepID=A0A6J5MKW4_9CAUD|nr:hypothetical protein UFOVP510_49 [uncultured Caudovirales phage]